MRNSYIPKYQPCKQSKIVAGLVNAQNEYQVAHEQQSSENEIRASYTEFVDDLASHEADKHIGDSEDLEEHVVLSVVDAEELQLIKNKDLP